MDVQIRPTENNILGIDPRRLQQMDPRIVKMLGYDVYASFIGYVDGLHPLRGAKRMVEWLQRPLDPSPPTFARLDEDRRNIDVGSPRSRL